MWSSTAALAVGGAVSAAGETQLALTVRDAERTFTDPRRNSPVRTAAVMLWVSQTHAHNPPIVSPAPICYVFLQSLLNAPNLTHNHIHSNTNTCKHRV